MMIDGDGSEGASRGVADTAAPTVGLHFANTAEWHAGPSPEERLTSYDAAVAWAQKEGILGAAQAAGLLARARTRPAEAEEALKRILAVREAVYRIFVATAHGGSPDAADLEILNSELREASRHLRLGAPENGDGRRFTWTWTDLEDDLTSLLWPVARAVAGLLTSPQLARVRECAGYPCGWLFIDQSKNGSRRWCDMADCGNRAKARRYRERRKGEADGSS